MKDGYTVLKVLAVDFGKTKDGIHVPYPAGSIVRGPKGGLYALDLFCTEVMIREAFKGVVSSGDVLKRMVRTVGTTNIKDFTKDRSTDSAVRAYAASIKATPLIRKKGESRARTLGRSGGIEKAFQE